jgi:glycolate oxidase
MESWAFRHRVLRGVVTPDVRTTILGHAVDLPVFLAPIGSIQQFYPDGALGPARVAARTGTVCCVGTLAAPRLEEVAQAASGPLIFQLYVRGDRDWLADTLARVERSGYAAVCLTADSSGSARRERDLHSRHARATGARPNLPDDARETEAFQVRFTWQDFDWLRSMTRLPLILKGVLTTEDAVEAVERGADAIYVSNHGGRELDHNPSSMEVLPEIVAAVGDRAEVYVDSGFLHAADVIKALALGARAVGLGKLQVWGIAAGGEAGLEQTLDILEDELVHDLRHLGAASVGELCPAYVRPSIPTGLTSLEWNQYEYPGLPRV